MKNYLILSILTFILSSIPMWMPSENESITLLILHSIEAFVCSFSLFLYHDRPFSLFKVFHLFFLFFLCIAPIMQFKYDILLWDGMPFSEWDYILTSFVLLCTLLIYNIVYYVIYKSNRTSFIGKIESFLDNPLLELKPLTIFEAGMFLVLAFTILYSVLYINNFNLLSLIFRGGDLEEVELIENVTDNSVPQSLNLVIVNFLRPMIITLFLSSFVLRAKRFFVFLMFLFVLLIAFPTSMPRFSAAAMYIPILLVFSPLFRKKNAFVLSAIVGLLVIFPFLNNFRYFTENTEIQIGVDFGMFTEGHFDSYSSMLRVLKYDIVTYGRQLLGVFLFWVPRSVWINKPIGSGAFMCDELHLSFDNISCCFFAEGYINAGFVGLLLFLLFFAAISAFLDNAFWQMSLHRNSQNIFFRLIYFFLLGLFFFLLRGDLLSSFAYIMGFVCSVLFVFKLLTTNRMYKFSF